MNILLAHYTEITSPGGIHKTIREIAKNLSRKHEVNIIQGNPLNLPEVEYYEGYTINRFKSKLGDQLFGFSPEMYFYFKKFLKKLKPDIIHVHGYHKFFSPEIIYFTKKIEPKIPVVFSPHLDIYRSSFAGKYLWNIYNLFGKTAFDRSSYITSCSNFEAQTIINEYNIDKEKLSIINHGVNLFKQNNFNKNEKINLVYSGHLIDRKGIDFILKGLQSLIYELNINNVNLTIIGEGPEKEKLVKLSNDLKLNDYIVWKPFLARDEFIDEITKADIFMLLSNSEAYGIVIAESLALGTPCIVANRAALTELTEENGCFGVDYPPNPKEVANLILKIYKRNITAGPLSKKIKSWHEVVKDYEKLYLELLASK
ncbi:MAG TPA: glycosyltransferase family 4 protein [Methanobacterium sp.]|nr:glycosyltransferase family 4 protein [Methanobacterium sp.]